MTKKEYIALFKECCEKMIDITERKNHDYTGGSEDPFANFKSVQVLGICTTEQGFLTRMTDKFSRIISFTNQGTLKVKDESIEDTLLDLATYSILFLAHLKDQKNEGPKPPKPVPTIGSQYGENIKFTRDMFIHPEIEKLSQQIDEAIEKSNKGKK